MNRYNQDVTRRSIQPVSTAALVAMACLLTAGVASEASTQTVLVCLRQGSMVSQADQRESVSRWLAGFAAAARQLQGQTAAVIPGSLRVPAFERVRTLACDLPATQVPRLDLHVSPHVIDLPPPTA